MAEPLMDWRVFNPPGPEAYGGETPAEQAQRRADYLAMCVCVYCGARLEPGDTWGFVQGQPSAPGAHTARAHLVHRRCWEQDRG